MAPPTAGTTTPVSQRTNINLIKVQKNLNERLAQLAGKIAPLNRSISDLTTQEKKQEKTSRDAIAAYQKAMKPGSKATTAQKAELRQKAGKASRELRATRKEKTEKEEKRAYLRKDQARLKEVNKMTGQDKIKAGSTIRGKEDATTGTIFRPGEARQAQDPGKLIPIKDKDGNIAIDEATGMPRYTRQGHKKKKKGSITRMGDKPTGPAGKPWEHKPTGPTYAGITYTGSGQAPVGVGAKPTKPGANIFGGTPGGIHGALGTTPTVAAGGAVSTTYGTTGTTTTIAPSTAVTTTPSPTATTPAAPTTTPAAPPAPTTPTIPKPPKPTGGPPAHFLNPPAPGTVTGPGPTVPPRPLGAGGSPTPIQFGPDGKPLPPPPVGLSPIVPPAASSSTVTGIAATVSAVPMPSANSSLPSFTGPGGGGSTGVSSPSPVLTSGLHGPAGGPGATGATGATSTPSTTTSTTPDPLGSAARTELTRIEKEKQDRRDALEEARAENEKRIRAERDAALTAQGLPKADKDKPVYTVGTSIDRGALKPQKGGPPQIGMRAEQGIRRKKKEDEVDYELVSAQEGVDNMKQVLDKLKYDEGKAQQAVDKGGTDAEKKKAEAELKKARGEIDKAQTEFAKRKDKLKALRDPKAVQQRLLKKRLGKTSTLTGKDRGPLEGEELRAGTLGDEMAHDPSHQDSDFASTDLRGGDGTLKRREEYNFGKDPSGAPIKKSNAGMTSAEVQALIPKVTSNAAASPAATIAGVGTPPGGLAGPVGAPGIAGVTGATGAAPAPGTMGASLAGIASGGAPTAGEPLAKIAENTAKLVTMMSAGGVSMGTSLASGESPKDFSERQYGTTTSEDGSGSLQAVAKTFNTVAEKIGSAIEKLGGVKFEIPSSELEKITAAVAAGAAGPAAQEGEEEEGETQNVSTTGGTTEGSGSFDHNVTHSPIELSGEVNVTGGNMEEIKAMINAAIYEAMSNLGLGHDVAGDPKPPEAGNMEDTA